MSRNFSEWLTGFRDSIADYGYYIDFKKIHRNVDSIKVELNILNSLIGSKDIENDFEKLINKYPETLGTPNIILSPFLYTFPSQADTASRVPIPAANAKHTQLKTILQITFFISIAY